MYLQGTGPWWKAKVGSKTGLIPSNYGNFSCYFHKVFIPYQARMQLTSLTLLCIECTLITVPTVYNDGQKFTVLKFEKALLYFIIT